MNVFFEELDFVLVNDATGRGSGREHIGHASEARDAISFRF